MAELVGLIASVATLSKIVVVTSKILYDIAGVPHGVARVAQEVSLLTTQLQLLHEFEQSTGDSLPDLLKAFTSNLDQAEMSISKVQARLTQLALKSSGRRGRVRWLLFGKEEAEELFEELNHIRCALTLTLNLTMWSYQMNHAKAFKDIALTLQQASQKFITSTDVATDPQTSLAGKDLGLVASTSTNNSSIKFSSSKRTEFNLPLVGHVVGSLTSISEGNYAQTYSISFLMELPFRHALAANLLIRRFNSSWLKFRVHSAIAIPRLVEENSSFLVACQQGNIDAMEYLLANRLASPDETTIGGTTPMMAAIESGNVEAVRVLIREGADVNNLFGTMQTSPLAWALCRRHFDITRILLLHNASCQHVSSYGWTPLYYLWSDPDAAELPGSEAYRFLPMLAARPDFALSHSGVVDEFECGVIHQAAVCGTAKELSRLIELGVSPFSLNGPLKWSAIQKAVFHGKIENFRTLLPHYRGMHIDTPDARGWSLLHIAAAAGHGDIIEDLLKLGADWKALSKPFFSHMPEMLYGGRWTPAQVAEAQSLERKILYLSIVGDVFGNDVLVDDDLELVKGTYVDVEEYFDCASTD